MTGSGALPGRRVAFAALLAVLPTASACDVPARSGPTVIRADSAGVPVVETLEPVWTDGGAWQVDPVPELAIGLVEGDEAYLFGEIAGIVRLDDGQIAVADGQIRRIRFYDETGRYLRTRGGPGDGPGEFGSLSELWSCGPGRIYAWDRGRTRVSEWSARGELVREFALLEPSVDGPGAVREPGAVGRGPYRAACGPGGDFVVAGWGDLSQLSSLTESQSYAQNAPVWVLDADAQPVLELGEYVISERVLLLRPEGAGGSSGPHPLGRFASFALEEEGIWVGTAERLEVRAYDRDGTLLRILRGPPQDLALTPELMRRFREVARDVDRAEAQLLTRIEEMGLELPPGLPAFTEMRTDPEGRLWVRRFALPWDEVECWGVFAREGEFLGHVEMPPGLRMHQVGADFVLGLSADALGVEQVRLHRFGPSD